MEYRIIIDVSDEVYQVIDELARRRGKTIPEVIRDAIAREKWFDDTRQQGGQILVEKSGQIREAHSI